MDFQQKASALAAKCRNKAEREGYSSQMNDTKWRELCLAISQYEVTPAWRAKDFLTGHLSLWDREWFYHVGPDYCTIEWLEIDPLKCPEGQIKDTLEAIGVPFEKENYFRITAYKK